MKTIACTGCLIFALVTLTMGQSTQSDKNALTEVLVNLEKQSAIAGRMHSINKRRPPSNSSGALFA